MHDDFRDNPVDLNSEELRKLDKTIADLKKELVPLAGKRQRRKSRRYKNRRDGKKNLPTCA